MSFSCECGIKLRCIDTRKSKLGNYHVRRYECQECKKRYSTQEHLVETRRHGEYLVDADAAFNRLRIQMRDEVMEVFNKYRPKFLDDGTAKNESPEESA